MTEGDDLRRSLERLVTLGQTPDVNIKPVLLRVLVDLFVRKPHHAPSELVQFEEIVLSLLGEADHDARIIASDKLARHPATPATLIEHLLTLGEAVARPVFEHAALDQDRLLAAAALGPTETALVLARRVGLDAIVAKHLAERPEPEVLLALAENTSALLDRPTLQYLVRRAYADEALGRALLKRDGHPLDLAPLFLLADSAQRDAILLAARREDLGPESLRPRLTPEQAAALGRVERAILAPDHDGFDTSLSAALDIGLSEVWRIIDDPRGEPLALAMAALGASAELSARIFILSGPVIGHSVMTVRKLTGLVETIAMPTARRLIYAMAGHASRPLRRGPAIFEPAARPRPEGDAKPVRAVPRTERRLVAGKPR